MKLKIGETMPNIDYQTPFKNNLSFINNIKGNNTVLMFLRYYGCTLCQFDLMKIKESIDDFCANDLDIKVVLQSNPDRMREQLKIDPLPFDIICDPHQKLYKEFEINAANSKEELINKNAKEKIKKAKEIGMKHGEYEGEELQLPATIIINGNGKIVFSHYGKDASDIPSPEEILILAKRLL